MKKIYLMKNPELFQGEKYLNKTKNKNYFEGWYFKNTNNNEAISFIPGISINETERKTFIQVITNRFSCFINYDISEFKYNYKPFYIKIGNNYFSKEKLHIDINDKELKLKIHGNLKYSNSKNITTNILNPNIMGPFSYIPFMQCNHAILSMKNTINGEIIINDNHLIFNDGVGYIEKDYGVSFPKYYLWSQGNNFKNSNASFMLSIADIPFKLFNFRGLICTLIVNNKEYKFTTYNKTKIIKYEVDNENINILLKKGKYLLNIKSKVNSSLGLIAPIKGNMEKEIFESINSIVQVTLKHKDKIIFDDLSTNAGIEVVLT